MLEGGKTQGSAGVFSHQVDLVEIMRPDWIGSLEMEKWLRFFGDRKDSGLILEN